MQTVQDSINRVKDIFAKTAGSGSRRIRSIVAVAAAGSMAFGAAAFSAAPASAATATNNPAFAAYAMAPLSQLSSSADWSTFDGQLTAAKNEGLDGVAVDVWWGTVEGKAQNLYDWSYYDTLFQHIASHNLGIVPNFSFHSCGGNVGDTCNIPIPSWVWTQFNGQTFNGQTVGSDTLQFKSEQGHVDTEYVQGWADGLVDQDYADFTHAFVNHFAPSYGNAISEINISLGPAGELRYPSYDSQDTGSGWPGRGTFQAYSVLAEQDFQNWAVSKYGSLAGVNTAWGTALAAVSQILPPSDANGFFTRQDYWNTQYGKDLVDWYNGALVNHGQNVLSTVISALGSNFPKADVGYKVPGVNWCMTNPSYPRAAEIDAGLIQTSIDDNADATGHGYQNIVALANRAKTSTRPVATYFTAMEEDDNNTAAGGYSLAKSLAFWIANNAAAQGVTIKGENALEGGVTGDHGWDNINNAFDWAPYVGLDTLRLADVTSGEGAVRYSAFVSKYRPGYSSMYVRGTNNNWGLTPMTKVNGVWTANQVSFGSASGQSFKFDVSGDWSTNFGGTTTSGTATQNGGNIPASSNTTYNITFDPNTKAYTATPVAPASYSISGTIGGTGSVANVTVTAGGSSATTDALGNYTLGGLASGTYTVTASKDGDAFTQPNDGVLVNAANATGVNFTSTPGTTVYYQDSASTNGTTLHTWGGATNDLTMTSDGSAGGGNWWSATVPNAPSSFSFCFVDTNGTGTWDCNNRTYTSTMGAVVNTVHGSTSVNTGQPF